MTREHIRTAQQAAKMRGDTTFAWEPKCPSGHSGLRRTSDLACIKCLAGVSPSTRLTLNVDDINDVDKIKALVEQLNAAHAERANWQVYAWGVAEDARESNAAEPVDLRIKGR